MRKVFALILAVLMIVSLLAGCSSPAKPAEKTEAPTKVEEKKEKSPSAEETKAEEAATEAPEAKVVDGDKVIRIGVFEPVTGQNGGGGFQEVLGVRYANEKFPTVEIDGVSYKVELVEVDNKSDKTEAVAAAQNLVSKKVAIVLGSYGSGVSIAAGPTFEEAEIPAVGISCTNPQVTQGNEFYFRVCFLDPFQGKVMANYAIEGGAKTAAVITELGDDYSSGLGNFFLKAFKDLNGEIVSEEQFQTNQTDFKAILTNIKAKNPDVIFAPSSIATAPLLIKQARELGISAKIMAGDTWENETIIENAGTDSEGVAISTFFDENDDSNTVAADFVKGFKAFINANEEYKQKNGGTDGVAAVSALGYDSYIVAIEAIKAANSTDSVKIKDALKELMVEGVTGSISFDENGDAKKDMAYIKIISDGKFKFDRTVKAK